MNGDHPIHSALREESLRQASQQDVSSATEPGWLPVTIDPTLLDASQLRASIQQNGSGLSEPGPYNSCNAPSLSNKDENASKAAHVRKAHPNAMPIRIVHKFLGSDRTCEFHCDTIKVAWEQFGENLGVSLAAVTQGLSKGKGKYTVEPRKPNEANSHTTIFYRTREPRSRTRGSKPPVNRPVQSCTDCEQPLVDLTPSQLSQTLTSQDPENSGVVSCNSNSIIAAPSLSLSPNNSIQTSSNYGKGAEVIVEVQDALATVLSKTRLATITSAFEKEIKPRFQEVTLPMLRGRMRVKDGRSEYSFKSTMGYDGTVDNTITISRTNPPKQRIRKPVVRPVARKTDAAARISLSHHHSSHMQLSHNPTYEYREITENSNDQSISRAERSDEKTGANNRHNSAAQVKILVQDSHNTVLHTRYWATLQLAFDEEVQPRLNNFNLGMFYARMRVKKNGEAKYSFKSTIPHDGTDSNTISITRLDPPQRRSRKPAVCPKGKGKKTAKPK